MGVWAKLAKKAKHGDVVMTGIMVTKFKISQINVEDLEQMVANESRTERCSAAKKVLEAVKEAARSQPLCHCIMKKWLYSRRKMNS
jgi:hypothetical protein